MPAPAPLEADLLVMPTAYEEDDDYDDFDEDDYDDDDFDDDYDDEDYDDDDDFDEDYDDEDDDFDEDYTARRHSTPSQHAPAPRGVGAFFSARCRCRFCMPRYCPRM